MTRPTWLPVNGIVVDELVVLPEWIDYNGHMNVAYFSKAFEVGIDSYKALVGLTLDYIAREGRSTVALEAHVRYRREVALGDRIRVETRVADFDGKRVHVYQELYRDELLLATQETLAISFDTVARRSCAFEALIAQNYRQLFAAAQVLPRPELGRGITLDRAR
jgi:acyl-CoA thioester hydrolase